MEKDAVSLEVCTKDIRSTLIKKDNSRSMRACISHGQDRALRCRQWCAPVKSPVVAIVTGHAENL